MIMVFLTLCSLFEGNEESFLALNAYNLQRVCNLRVVVLLTRSSQATELHGCPIRVVIIAVMHVVHGVHSPMLLAEATLLLISKDQPLIGILQNPGVD